MPSFGRFRCVMAISAVLAVSGGALAACGSHDNTSTTTTSAASRSGGSSSTAAGPDGGYAYGEIVAGSREKHGRRAKHFQDVPLGRYPSLGRGRGRWPARRALRPYEPRTECAAPSIAVDLALGVLRGLAGSFKAGLLALFDAGIAGEQAGFAQGGAQLLLVREERAGDAVRDRVGPGANATAGHLGVDVEVAHQFSRLERQAQPV